MNDLPSVTAHTGVGSGGIQGIGHPNYLCGGDIDMYIPLEKPNTWKLYATRTEMLGRQRDGSEFKKTLRRAGLHPDPNEGAYSASAVGGMGWLSLPKNPIPTLGPRLSYPHSKISSDAVDCPNVCRPRVELVDGRSSALTTPPPSHNVIYRPLDIVVRCYLDC